jgi:hypothetical protein
MFGHRPDLSDQVRGSRLRQPERGNERHSSEVPSRVVHLFEVQLDSLREISERLVDRVALAGNVDLQALGDVPVLFAVSH